MKIAAWDTEKGGEELGTRNCFERMRTTLTKDYQLQM
jgi:hypothetical protein